MIQLTSFPFLLKDGDLIQVRAKNSDVATPVPHLALVPAKVLPPRLIAINETAAVLEWQVMGAHFTYELYWNDHQDSAFIHALETTDAQITVNLSPMNRVIEFKLRAKNACGKGPFSEALPVYQKGIENDAGKRPIQMTQPTLSVKDCLVRVWWQPAN